jgi:hypothetical protein
MAEYSKAMPEMVDTVKRVAGECHRRLDGVKIAVIQQDKAASSKGHIVMACASLVTKRFQPLLDAKYQFIVCIARDVWDTSDQAKRDALIDHELCHCMTDDDGAHYIRPHDLEEFADVIERRGFWRKDYAETAIQSALGLALPSGTIETPKTLPEAKPEDPQDAPPPADVSELETAVDIIRKGGRASTSMIQRVMKIGYNRANRIIETLEKKGVIGPANGVDPREVLNLEADLK